MARTHKKVRYLPKSKRCTPLAAARDVEQTFKVLEGRWKLLILFHLFGEKILRFSELGRAIPAISQKMRSEEHTSELQSRQYLVCRLLLEKKKKKEKIDKHDT